MLAIDKVTGRVVRVLRGTDKELKGLVAVRMPDGSRARVISSQLLVL